MFIFIERLYKYVIILMLEVDLGVKLMVAKK